MPLRNEVGKIIDLIDTLSQNPGAITGLSTGFKKLDEMTAGLQKGDLIIVAARPSMGKTTFSLNMAENAAFGPKQAKVGVFSMEMGREQLAFRMVSSLGPSRSNQAAHRPAGRRRLVARADGDLDDEVLEHLHRRHAGLVAYRSARSRAALEARAWARPDRGRLLAADAGARQQGKPHRRDFEISRSLKALAKELSVPVIALSQLNRAVEQRTDKRPVSSDLRESGAIEQDADIIMMIYREEVYNPETPRKGIADIIITKQRNGPTGDIELTFLGKFTKFENYAPEASRSATDRSTRELPGCDHRCGGTAQ